MNTNNFLFNFSNHKKISVDESNLKIASIFKRGLAGIIDIHITVVLMAIYLQISFKLFFLQKYQDFFENFYQTFGTRAPKNTPDHLNFIFNHQIFYLTIFLIISTILIGAIYHAYLNSSSWQGTIGKRIMKIIVTDNKLNKITFFCGIYHYFLSIIPYFFMIFVIFYARKKNVQLFELLTKDSKIFIIGILIIIANQINIFNKKKLNFFDYLAKVEFYSDKTPFIFPWNFNLKYKKK